jgi:hypothetical protein
MRLNHRLDKGRGTDEMYGFDDHGMQASVVRSHFRFTLRRTRPPPMPHETGAYLAEHGRCAKGPANGFSVVLRHRDTICLRQPRGDSHSSTSPRQNGRATSNKYV